MRRSPSFSTLSYTYCDAEISVIQHPIIYVLRCGDLHHSAPYHIRTAMRRSPSFSTLSYTYCVAEISVIQHPIIYVLRCGDLHHSAPYHIRTAMRRSPSFSTLSYTYCDAEISVIQHPIIYVLRCGDLHHSAPYRNRTAMRRSPSFSTEGVKWSVSVLEPSIGGCSIGIISQFPSGEWPGKLKLFATGVSTSCRISYLWQTVLIRSWFWVCPTYCSFSHTLHVIKCSTFMNHSSNLSEFDIQLCLLTFESCLCFYYAMKCTSGFIAGSKSSNTYPWWKVMLNCIWFIAFSRNQGNFFFSNSFWLNVS